MTHTDTPAPAHGVTPSEFAVTSHELTTSPTPSPTQVAIAAQEKIRQRKLEELKAKKRTDTTAQPLLPAPVLHTRPLPSPNPPRPSPPAPTTGHWELLIVRSQQKKMTAANPFLKFLHLGKAFNVKDLGLTCDRTTDVDLSRLGKLNPPSSLILELATALDLHPFLSVALSSHSAVNARRNQLELTLHNHDTQGTALGHSVTMVQLPEVINRAAVEPYIKPKGSGNDPLDQSLNHRAPTVSDVQKALVQENTGTATDSNNYLLPFDPDSGAPKTTALNAPNKDLLQARHELAYIPEIPAIASWLDHLDPIMRVHRSLALSIFPVQLLRAAVENLPHNVTDLHNHLDPEDLLPEELTTWLDHLFDADLTALASCPQLAPPIVRSHNHAKAIAAITVTSVMDALIAKTLDAHDDPLPSLPEFVELLRDAVAQLAAHFKQQRGEVLPQPNGLRYATDFGLLSYIADGLHEYALAIDFGLIYPNELITE
ncbi:hypothetical protein H2C43_07115 [Corynebacterium glutamicum]|uniref:Uncharacterized protein n=1 Tax=Corynebacterium glutamicum (strain ATCC 13032 / DSM 20300 / JCM 1318 / BCRC 11384 / CCUG 27702 / LMG 3730 / NBRC 12168 / NCIMB 10025 / NRRL B-2784 / 534) TaxID=196627 RepID=Q8NPF7_CORGL|nr:hypothetical protein [Corynebacterium glutamicum]AUI01336.1 hypothetical protein CYL77_09380 [Corynebacterium glutamicum]AUI04984.1 hypothetical protein C0I99_13075 [Corynebacterium glutamicum]MBA4571777.1 hypothetical protein [Corynebacterium glutamicum]MBA4574712.1 hypothetical protein [Corynebacterium glutamicum]MBA4577641.1 hypothetical protein [Corynebacterium glutamicum]